jgi:hypothetical protein
MKEMTDHLVRHLAAYTMSVESDAGNLCALRTA